MNYEKSKGNYFVDADGNTILDMNGGIGNNPLGWNHDAMIKFTQSKECDRFLIQTPSLMTMPPADYTDMLGRIMMPVRPHGMGHVILSHDISSRANEEAIKAAFKIKALHDRDGSKYSVEQLESSRWNQAPGTPNYKVVCFSNAFHGFTLGTLSGSHHPGKANLPMFNWPVVDFPTGESDEERALS